LTKWAENSRQVGIGLFWILVGRKKFFVFFLLLFVCGEQFEQALRIFLLQKIFNIAKNRFKTAIKV
jgi:hypothetical protein